MSFIVFFAGTIVCGCSFLSASILIVWRKILKFFISVLCLLKSTSTVEVFRGGSRIPRRRGRQPSRRGAPAYKFARFSEKLHEIKKILVRRGGGRAGGARLGSATGFDDEAILSDLAHIDRIRTFAKVSHLI